MINLPHRKTVRHFDRQYDCHGLTFSCYQRRPILDNDDRRKLLSRAIDAAVVRLGFRLVAFVYMPEHVHMLVWAKEPGTKIEGLLYAIKRPHSFRVKKLLVEAQDPLLNELTILERPGKWTFRFWQEGPGFDQNLEADDDVNAVAEYYHHNPVRREICQHPGDYKWSSWRHYHRPSDAPDPDLPIIHGFPPCD